VIPPLDQIIEWRGAPNSIRCDNRSDYISTTTTEWIKIVVYALISSSQAIHYRMLMWKDIIEKLDMMG
jgi:hypothetical protein